MEVLEVLLQRSLEPGYLAEHFAVDVLQASARGGPAFEILVGKHHGAVHEVAENRHELAVVALLEVLPAEIVVLGLRSVGGQHVAHHVLLAGEVLEIFVRPYGPVARSGYLVALEVEEFVGRHVVRKDIASVGLEHRGEHYAVEHYVVLAYEMYQAGVIGLPPPLPIIGEKLPGVGDIAYGSVEPHVEHLALGPLHGHRDAPLEVAGHGAGLQASVQPALDLAVDIGPPFLVTLQYPFTQPLLIVLQGKVPVGGLLLYGSGSAELALGVQQLLRAQGAAAFLTLVAVGPFGPALGACADYVTVGKEGPGLRVVVLLGLADNELAFIVELAEEVRSRLLMYGGGRPAVDVEIDAQPGEGVPYQAVVPVHYVLGRTALLAGLDCDGHPVFVGAAHEQHVLALQAKIPDVYVGRHVDSGQMSYMHRAVGVRQGAGYKRSLEF